MWHLRKRVQDSSSIPAHFARPPENVNVLRAMFPRPSQQPDRLTHAECAD